MKVDRMLKKSVKSLLMRQAEMNEFSRRKGGGRGVHLAWRG